MRNRLKRYIRAVLTENRDWIAPDLDFLVIARPYARDFDWEKTRENLLHALNLAHVIEEMPNKEEK